MKKYLAIIHFITSFINTILVTTIVIIFLKALHLTWILRLWVDIPYNLVIKAYNLSIKII